MKFENVSIVGLATVDAPHRISSQSIVDQLMPVHERLDIPPNILDETAGIQYRHFWDEGTKPSDGATLAAEKVLQESGIAREGIGALVNTSVCKDYLEPSTACLVHGNLQMSDDCINFDIGNACLGFLNGMQVIANMIERGQIEYGMIVDAEDSRPATESTIQRLLQPDVTVPQFRSQFATLTLGSGAAAMILGRADKHPEGHRFLGGVTMAATKWNRLCLGNMDEMVTDTKTLLVEGIGLSVRTWMKAAAELGWTPDAIDEFVTHQVSKIHTETFASTLGLDLDKFHRVYPEYGNIGPAGLPTVLDQTSRLGRVKSGDRIGLIGIGSGLNCAMAEVVW